MEGFWGCRKRKRSPSAAGQGWPEPETTDKPSVVRLNVGGREYITSTSTLQKVGDSMLARMIQSSIPSATQNGAYFIDRDPDLFAYILEYLRDGAVELPSSSEPLRRLEREASFFMLPGLESLVRSRLLEVCLEVKIFAKPFGCSDEECKCGSNSLAHLNEFSDAEINAMDAEIDGYLDHPAREVRPSFQSPFATIHVVIKTQLPRNAWDAQVTVSGCPSPMTMSDLFSPAVLDLLKRCQQCWGTYVADGSLNDHPKYTNPNGAVMYWSSGKWKLNSEASTEEHVYSVDAVDDTPPRGVWCGEAGFKCMVDGVDFPRPQEASMAKAMQAIRRALVECEGLGLVHIEDVLKPVPDILRKFVEEPELSYHELHLKTGGYNVGDHYVKKEQRHHFKTCVKFEIATRSHSECKRRRDWEPAVDALNEAEEAFGLGGAQSFAENFTEGGAPWHRSEGWAAARDLRSVLTRMPELRKLVRRIGRRAAVRGPRRWLPAEAEELGCPQGVARSVRAPSEASGIARSGAIELMLPAEAHLLVQGRKRSTLRALHHARRLEQSLLSYHRASWMEVPTRELRAEEVRPAGENGPLILCLDTSGSMARKGGAPETVAKALVFECLRQAQEQQRRCCLFAFSTGAELQQLDLDLSALGLDRLLEFLSFAFHGGTSLNEVLLASVERLGSSQQWQNADLLLVTDGEVPKPSDGVLESLGEARAEYGARVYGVVVGSKTGAVMQSLCSELYHFTRRVDAGKAPEHRAPLEPKDWALRRVRAETAVAATWAPRAAASGRSTFAGASAAGAPRGRVARPALREASLQGQERRETVSERSEREARWAEREKLKQREHEQELQAKMGKRWRWVNGRWQTKEESEAQDAKIELVYQESRLQEANLQLELKKHFQSRFTAPEAARFPEDSVAARWAEDNLTRFEDELLSLLMLASREASRLGNVEFHPEAALLGLFRCSAGKEICQDGLEKSFSEVTNRSRDILEACIRKKAHDDADFDYDQDLPFAPELRQLLESVEAERARLQHQEAKVGHLVLALTAPRFRKTWKPLVALGLEPEQLRPAALRSLGGFFAAAESLAEAELLERCAAVFPSRCGTPLAGLGGAFKAITQGLVERSVEAKLLLLAALSGEHLFLLGSPGTAKSLLARRLSQVCEGSFFERLLTRFSVPEELFGPLSLQALEEDELRRKTRGYLPEADVAFIDEIFKANSSILNALLMILNERCFDNGDQRVPVPLWCAAAASNELPDTDELDALYDRFLLRRCVNRISKRSVQNFLRLTLDKEEDEDTFNADQPHVKPLLSMEDSIALQKRARKVEFPDSLLEVVAELREFLAEEAEPRFEVSDRRLAKAVRLLRIAAAAAGGSRVIESDLLLLRHVFWDRDPAQGQLVVEWLLRRFADSGSGQKVPEHLPMTNHEGRGAFGFMADMWAHQLLADHVATPELEPGHDFAYVTRKAFVPKALFLDGMSCETGDPITITHDPRASSSTGSGALAYGRNERTGQRGWFPLSATYPMPSSFLEREGTWEAANCQDTYFSDWGSSGMKVHSVHTGGGGEFLPQVQSVKLGLTAKSDPELIGPKLNELALELQKAGSRYVLRNGWEILSTAGHRLEVENAERLFNEVRRLGDVPVSRGGLQGLLYKCSERLNETEGCRTLPGYLEAVYEMGAYLMSLSEEARKYRKIKSRPMGFVSAGGASLQIGITSPNASHAAALRRCIARLQDEVEVENEDGELFDEQPGSVTSLGDIAETPPGSRRKGPSLAKVSHFPDGQLVALFSFLAVGTNPGPCIEGGCAHEVGGVNEMRLQFENHLIQQGYASNPCVESAADFPLGKGTATYTQRLQGGASGSEEDRVTCQTAVTQFLDSDLTLRKWKAESGCSQLAAAVPSWGLLTSFGRIRAEGPSSWCSSGGPFRGGQVNCGAVLTQTLMDSILDQLGVSDAKFQIRGDVGWEAALYALRGLESGVCFKT
ncbi:ravA [Symbiodinium natans]|uniref:RavA protein n=1 Tax=Symbiodinium natans TaxID=878477 RepID=A0A812K0V2_9DINO|nr:ravA [Symbiodinium natans]